MTSASSTRPPNGRPTLDIHSRVFPDGYEERLIIDADTGVPIQSWAATRAGRPAWSSTTR